LSGQKKKQRTTPRRGKPLYLSPGEKKKSVGREESKNEAGDMHMAL